MQTAQMEPSPHFSFQVILRIVWTVSAGPVCSSIHGCAGTPAPAPIADGKAPLVRRTTLTVQGHGFSLHLPPDRSAPLRSVLVLHSAMGRTESVLDWCDRLAQRGFAAVAFDFYDGAVASSITDARRLRDKANERSNEFERLLLAAYDALGADSRLLSRQHPGYAPDAAEAAWERTLEFLEAH